MCLKGQATFLTVNRWTSTAHILLMKAFYHKGAPKAFVSEENFKLYFSLTFAHQVNITNAKCFE